MKIYFGDVVDSNGGHKGVFSIYGLLLIVLLINKSYFNEIWVSKISLSSKEFSLILRLPIQRGKITLNYDKPREKTWPRALPVYFPTSVFFFFLSDGNPTVLICAEKGLGF